MANLRWRPYQFSLRTFLLLLTVACLWLGWRTEEWRKQAGAVKEIESLGGVVRYDWQTKSHIWSKGGGPTYHVFDSSSGGPPWMHDFFQKVEAVYFFDRRSATGAEVRESIPYLKRLRWLNWVHVQFWTTEEMERELRQALPDCELR